MTRKAPSKGGIAANNGKREWKVGVGGEGGGEQGCVEPLHYALLLNASEMLVVSIIFSRSQYLHVLRHSVSHTLVWRFNIVWDR